jgi:hypothetical protein
MNRQRLYQFLFTGLAVLMLALPVLGGSRGVASAALDAPAATIACVPGGSQNNCGGG